MNIAEKITELRESVCECHPSHYKLPHPSNCLGLNVGSDTIPVKFMVPFPSHFGIEEGARHMWL